MRTRFKQAEAALKAATEYVGTAQPLLDDYRAKEERFIKRAHAVVGGLVARGLVRKSKSDELITKLASDPLVALDLVEKVAENIRTADLGRVSTEKVASNSNFNAFERLVLFGSPTGTANSGMVD